MKCPWPRRWHCGIRPGRITVTTWTQCPSVGTSGLKGSTVTRSDDSEATTAESSAAQAQRAPCSESPAESASAEARARPGPWPRPRPHGPAASSESAMGRVEEALRACAAARPRIQALSAAAASVACVLPGPSGVYYSGNLLKYFQDLN